MAEGDRDAYRREQAAIAREREIMKDVKGWEVGDPCVVPHDELMIDCDSLRSGFWLLLFSLRVSQAGKSVYNSSRYHSPDIVIL